MIQTIQAKYALKISPLNLWRVFQVPYWTIIDFWLIEIVTEIGANRYKAMVTLQWNVNWVQSFC